MKIKIILLFITLFIVNSIFPQAEGNNHLLVLKTLNKYGSYKKAIDHSNSIPNDIITDYILLEKSKALFELNETKNSTNIAIQLYNNIPLESAYHLARCYAQLNKPEIACKYLEEHLNSRQKLPLSNIKSDKAFETIEKSDEWIELWRKKDWYTKYDILFEDALYEFNLGNYTESLELFNKLTNIRKSMHKALFYKSMVYEKLNDYQNALIAIGFAIDKKDDISAYYYQQSVVELKLGKTKKAIKAIEKALVLDNSNIDYYMQRSKVNLSLNKIDKAIADLNLLTSLIDDSKINFLASEIYFEAGNYNKSLININKCIKDNKYNPHLYLVRANIYMKTHTYNFAENDLSMALDFLPYEGEIYYNRGIARIHLKKTELACSDFQKAYKFKYLKSEQELSRYCQKYMK